ncbi:hypothetical protein ACD592_21060 [Rhizobium sp. 969_B3_N1_2]|uniref:hypothetical protein n=1 Tax=Rhizobium sp. 969_B3_N1_2 TaxID=3276278 RepID=UPI003F21CF50
MHKQPISEAVEDDDWIPDGVMWPPEREIDAFEVHASLAKAVAGSRGVRFFSTRLIDVPSDAPLGAVQIIDEIAAEACGIYPTTYVADVDAETGDPILVDEATRPFKFPSSGGLDGAISTFCKTLQLAGIIP